MVESHGEVSAGEHTPTEIESAGTEEQNSEADFAGSQDEEDAEMDSQAQACSQRNITEPLSACTGEQYERCEPSPKRFRRGTVQQEFSEVHDVETAEPEDSLLALACKPVEVIDSSDEDVEGSLRWPILPTEPSEIQPHWSKTDRFIHGVQTQF